MPTRQICMHPISRLSLARIRPADIARYRNTRLESVGANTVRLELAPISHLYTVAIEAWDMEYLQNPVRRSSRPGVAGTARDRRLVDDEEARLLEAARNYNPRAYALIVVAIETAVRRGELAASHRFFSLCHARQIVQLPLNSGHAHRFFGRHVRQDPEHEPRLSETGAVLHRQNAGFS